MPAIRPDDRVLRPGFRVPYSGTYKVIHTRHRGDHFVTAIKGERFPYCRKCRDRVEFVLWAEADYVAHDWDFSGPSLELVK